MKPSASEKTMAMRDSLRKRYAAPAYALVEEVGNATGFGCNRHADAIAIGLWPSRGLEIHGFELKASRSDWLKELQDPAKADSIVAYCDRWFVVAADDKIVQPGELPPTWGLMLLSGSGLRCASEAPKLDAKPLDRKFVAALARRIQELVPDAERSAERRGYERGKAEGPADISVELENARNMLAHLDAKVAEFKRASGVDIARAWDGGRIGAAVRMVLNANHDVDPSIAIARAAELLERQAEGLRSSAAELEKAYAAARAATETAA